MICRKRSMTVQAITATTVPAIIVRKICSQRFRTKRLSLCAWGTCSIGVAGENGAFNLFGVIQKLSGNRDQLVPVAHFWGGCKLLSFSEHATLMHFISSYRQVNPVEQGVVKLTNHSA